MAASQLARVWSQSARRHSKLLSVAPRQLRTARCSQRRIHRTAYTPAACRCLHWLPQHSSPGAWARGVCKGTTCELVLHAGCRQPLVCTLALTCWRQTSTRMYFLHEGQLVRVRLANHPFCDNAAGMWGAGRQWSRWMAATLPWPPAHLRACSPAPQALHPRLHPPAPAADQTAAGA